MGEHTIRRIPGEDAVRSGDLVIYPDVVGGEELRALAAADVAGRVRPRQVRKRIEAEVVHANRIQRARWDYVALIPLIDAVGIGYRIVRALIRERTRILGISAIRLRSCQIVGNAGLIIRTQRYLVRTNSNHLV